MKKHLLYLLMLIMAVSMFGCGKSQHPGYKFTGLYSVEDQWKSSKELIGNGNLEYDLIIIPYGEDGVMLMNVNKTLNKVKAKIDGDKLVFQKQTVKSAADKSYSVAEQTGTISENKLEMDFEYSDSNYGDLIGTVTCKITGKLEKD